eukprot:TRINITY_DN22401_c0_g2_i1.p1 TRINITY_DN22401_c0_g2~~TRINITY_DN22401_c0_g2_i1.p1  ORF type:complete len:203 (-),score=23.90 TRINITY_DN22401_c0_g2_i1:26-634(-)
MSAKLIAALVLLSAISTTSSRATCLKDPPKTFSGKVAIAKASWDSSIINVEIAKYLLEEQLGIQVDDPIMSEPDSFTAMTNHTLEAFLELWPEGWKSLVQEYIVSKKVVEDGGDLTSIGRIGWYIPTFALDNCSDCDTYKVHRVAPWSGEPTTTPNRDTANLRTHSSSQLTQPCRTGSGSTPGRTPPTPTRTTRSSLTCASS